MRRPLSVSSHRSRLCLVALERRDVPSAALYLDDVQPTVMAGRPAGLQADTPAQRIDPNSSDSPFAGVGSLIVNSRGTPFVGTATAIDRWHIVTAAHVVDVNGDGKFNKQDRTTGVFFNLNLGGDRTHRIAVASFNLHPDYTGFNTPSINDDIAVLKLAEPLPEGTPTYSLPGGGMTLGTVITIVGYGRSGSGAGGYTTAANAAIKRVGQNTVDGFYGQDDANRAPANEVYRFDFDGPSGDGPLGGNTLGNGVESQLGPGDSGGPAFVLGENGYVIVGINTYVQGNNAPRFGSMGGGISVFPAIPFILEAMDRDPSSLPGGISGGENETAPDPNPPSGDEPPVPPPAININAKAIRGIASFTVSSPKTNFLGRTKTEEVRRFWLLPPVETPEPTRLPPVSIAVLQAIALAPVDLTA